MNPNQLNSEQIDQLKKWAAEGLDLNAMQKRMNEEMGLRLTYMDARFLLLDLHIDLVSPQPAAEEKKEEPSPSEIAPPVPAGSTVVTIDEITPPHALLTGKVTFMSGCQGRWSIDKMGRIDWEPTFGEPTPDDLKGFERELQKTLRSQMGGI